MKMRTLGLVTGMIMIAVNAGTAHAAEFDAKTDMPDIFKSIDAANYQQMSKVELAAIEGKSGREGLAAVATEAMRRGAIQGVAAEMRPRLGWSLPSRPFPEKVLI